MTAAVLLAACVVAWVGATGAFRRFNTIAIRAASTGFLLVAASLLALDLALRLPVFLTLGGACR